VTGYITLRIRFDEEIKIAHILVGRYWGVGANNLLRLAIDFEGSSDRHVLANW